MADAFWLARRTECLAQLQNRIRRLQVCPRRCALAGVSFSTLSPG